MRASLLTIASLALLCGGSPQARAMSELCSSNAAKVSVGAEDLPTLSGRVEDGAQLLTSATEARLTAELASLERRTRDQLVVVTLASLKGKRIEQVGIALGNGWGIGDDELNNGVLLIIAPEERKVRIEVGCGLEGLLTNERAKSIIDATLLPLLRTGDYDRAATAGVLEIKKVLESEGRRPVPAHHEGAS